MTKYIYMKILGLLTVIIGFSYSLTSFYNFYAYIFGDVVIANANVYIMSFGLMFPLYTFIFGVYFYFYTDRRFDVVNPFIYISSIAMIIVAISRIFVNNGIMEFIHISYSFALLLLAALYLYGCYTYKY